MSHYQFSAQIERDRETGVYVAYLPALHGTQAGQKTGSASDKSERAIDLCLEELTADEIAALSEFVGFQQIAVDL